jgi:precorrin-6B methylase 2
MKTGVVSRIKSKIVPDQSRVRRVLFGLYRGQRLEINLQSEAQLYFGLWEREIYSVIRCAGRRAQWFLDVGAGKGELCIWFATLGHVTRIIAVEPNTAETQALRANLVTNKIAQNGVEVVSKFAGTSEDTSYIQLDKLEISDSLPGFIKIDVDGSELDVLQSGKMLLSQGNVETLIETHSLELEQSCMEWLSARGYTCKVIKNAWWRSVIPEHRPIAHNRWFHATRSNVNGKLRTLDSGRTQSLVGENG